MVLEEESDVPFCPSLLAYYCIRDTKMEQKEARGTAFSKKKIFFNLYFLHVPIMNNISPKKFACHVVMHGRSNDKILCWYKAQNLFYSFSLVTYAQNWNIICKFSYKCEHFLGALQGLKNHILSGAQRLSMGKVGFWPHPFLQLLCCKWKIKIQVIRL